MCFERVLIRRKTLPYGVGKRLGLYEIAEFVIRQKFVINRFIRLQRDWDIRAFNRCGIHVKHRWAMRRTQQKVMIQKGERSKPFSFFAF